MVFGGYAFLFSSFWGGKAGIARHTREEVSDTGFQKGSRNP